MRQSLHPAWRETPSRSNPRTHRSPLPLAPSGREGRGEGAGSGGVIAYRRPSSAAKVKPEMARIGHGLETGEARERLTGGRFLG